METGCGYRYDETRREPGVNRPSLSQVFMGLSEHSGRRGRRGALQDSWAPVSVRVHSREYPNP